MNLTLQQLVLFAGSMGALWAVPGPVWVALVARALSGGMRGAWPLAVGVAIGDVVWLVCAIFGLSWVLASYGDLLAVLRWIAAVVFVVMGVMLLRAPVGAFGAANARLTTPGVWPGIAVGLAAVIGNPKAILFYMGVLPGFFDLSGIGAWDIAAILGIATVIPMVGNLCLALFLDRVRGLLHSPLALRRMNAGSGCLLILVGLVIPFV